MKLEITKEWLEKRAALEGDSEIGAGLPTYVPPFIPSEADRYYGAIIAKMQAALASHTSALAERDARIAELEAALSQIAEMSNWQIGVPTDTEAANEHARIAQTMADTAHAVAKAKSFRPEEISQSEALNLGAEELSNE